MKRSGYFNYIEEKLNTLSYRIKARSKINLLDLNIHSETFFAELVSLLLKYNLKNINIEEQNIEGIDLIDNKNKIFAQVSSTCTKQKIENSLAKNIFESYPDYKFIFIPIAGDANKLRTKTFKNPHSVIFSPKNDIYDISSLLSLVLDMNINELRKLYMFIRDELGEDIDIVKVDTNLANIINILSHENLDVNVERPQINSFQIEKKIEFNNLNSVKSIIDDYKIYYSKLDEKYREFDKQGANKSFSVLSKIRKEYFSLSEKYDDSSEIFFKVIDNIIDIISSSKNYIEIPYEELEMCVSIIVVDAFIRCKIFENPEGYEYAIT